MPHKDPEVRKAWRKAYNEKNRDIKKEYNQKYSKAHREKIRKLSNIWAENNPLVIRNYVFKRRYGITLVEYNKLFESQKGCCAICGTHQSKFTKSLHVDHCHKLNKIRGLLCVNCNTALGHFKEDIILLQEAVEKDNVFLSVDSKKGLGKFCNDINNLQSAINYLRA